MEKLASVLGTFAILLIISANSNAARMKPDRSTWHFPRLLPEKTAWPPFDPQHPYAVYKNARCPIPLGLRHEMATKTNCDDESWRNIAVEECARRCTNEAGCLSFVYESEPRKPDNDIPFCPYKGATGDALPNCYPLYYYCSQWEIETSNSVNGQRLTGSDYYIKLELPFKSEAGNLAINLFYQGEGENPKAAEYKEAESDAEYIVMKGGCQTARKENSHTIYQSWDDQAEMSDAHFYAAGQLRKSTGISDVNACREICSRHPQLCMAFYFNPSDWPYRLCQFYTFACGRLGLGAGEKTSTDQNYRLYIRRPTASYFGLGENSTTSIPPAMRTEKPITTPSPVLDRCDKANTESQCNSAGKGDVGCFWNEVDEKCEDQDVCFQLGEKEEQCKGDEQCVWNDREKQCFYKEREEVSCEDQDVDDCELEPTHCKLEAGKCVEKAAEDYA